MDRTYVMRSGIAKGLRKHGGLGLRQSLGLWRSPSAREDAYLHELDLEGAVVYDIGGFEGLHTIFFASRVGERGRVLVFEPVPENVRTVRRHVALNGFEDRVEVREQGVAGETGTLTFHAPDDRGRTSADPAIAAAIGEARTLRVPVVSVDDVVEDGAPPPAFVKVDVEGLELDVLRGMARTLTEHRPQLFIELHGIGLAAKAANARAVAELLLDHGYGLIHVETGGTVATAGATPPEGHLHAVAAT